MPEQDPRVPPEVEEYLIGVYAQAGKTGGRIGGALAGAPTGGMGGGRGGARGARRLKTLVEERVAVSPGGNPLERVVAAFPKAGELAREDDLVRLVVPTGLTGLQQIVVDLDLPAAARSADAQATEVRLRAYGKEGVISRKPTAKTADKMAAVISGSVSD